MKIYVVQGCIEYSNCSYVKAFLYKERAEDFIKLCESFDISNIPECPDIKDSDEIWEEYAETMNMIVDSHPAQSLDIDYYKIEAIEVEE